jgi:hypothetical protein
MRALFDELRCDAIASARSVAGLAASWHGKNPGRALRLALVYQFLAWAARQDAEPLSVSADAMARAGGFLDYAASMLDRVTAGLAIGRAESDAAAIARYLLSRRVARLNERELYQTTGYAWARSAERRGAALIILTQAGWIRQPTAGGYGRPRRDWDVSSRLAEAP